jgi:hypothetical protein
MLRDFGQTVFPVFADSNPGSLSPRAVVSRVNPKSSSITNSIDRHKVGHFGNEAKQGHQRRLHGSATVASE